MQSQCMSAFDRLTERQPLLDGPARQHYVSKFCLKGFAQNRRVSVYDRTTGGVDALTPKMPPPLSISTPSLTKAIDADSRSKPCSDS